MTAQPFVSFAQNGEDVVLWRALHNVPVGRYVEVGANHPREHSVSRAFYDRGWSGIAVEPVPAFADLFRAERPRDVVVEAAISDADTDTVVLHAIEGTGLSTLDADVGVEHLGAGWQVRDIEVASRRLDDVLDEYLGPDEDIHFLLVDTEGAEPRVLASVDLARRRPWVLIVEATAPMSSRQVHERWEPLVLAAGYEFCLFDGISRFYVATERAEALRDALSYPACALDPWVPHRTADLAEQVARGTEERRALREEVVRWRGRVLEQWSSAASIAVDSPGLAGQPGREAARLRAELDALHGTVSWRVTRPLRVVRSRQLRRSTR